jgi:hypothetical protein
MKKFAKTINFVVFLLLGDLESFWLFGQNADQG